MDILNQLSNHLITEVCHKMSALLAFFAIKFLPSATALMAPTNEKRTEVNWIVNDGFVPNDGQMISQQVVQGSSEERSGANGVGTQGDNRPSDVWASSTAQPVPHSCCKLRLSFSQTLLITVH